MQSKFIKEKQVHRASVDLQSDGNISEEISEQIPEQVPELIEEQIHEIPELIESSQEMLTSLPQLK